MPGRVLTVEYKNEVVRQRAKRCAGLQRLVEARRPSGECVIAVGMARGNRTATKIPDVLDADIKKWCEIIKRLDKQLY